MSGPQSRRKRGEPPSPVKCSQPSGKTPTSPRPFLLRNLQRRIRIDSRALKVFANSVACDLLPDSPPVTLVLVGDARMRVMNREFRGMDKPTDVLSFSWDDACAAHEEPYLGDIVVSVETARRQAKRRRSTLDNELRILVLHGFLHLMGYDHETDEGEMRRLEYRLRRRHKLTRPRRPSKRLASTPARRKKAHA